MNIRETLRKNLEDLVLHLHEVAALDVSQLGSEWEQRKVELERDAVYLSTFVIPNVEPAAPRIATFVPPERVDVALTPEDSSAGVPFLTSSNGR